MKNLLWLVNSILAFLFLCIIGYSLISIKNITTRPEIISIKASTKAEVVQKERAKPKDLQFIYESNDLFNTYYTAVKVEKKVNELPAVPQPPTPKPVIHTPPPVIQFLEPLPIKISGIITSSNDAKSYVTVVNNNTKRTETYKIGDKLFDSYIVRILPKKVILVRSNGQQEIIFASEEDAQEEMQALKESSWSLVIEKLSDSAYNIIVPEFLRRINNLAQLIEMLDTAPASKKGVKIGCRIGKMAENSIGYALGLFPEDIITKINGISPTTTDNKVKIYNSITQLPIGSSFKINLLRSGQSMTNEYFFKDESSEDKQEIPKSKKPILTVALNDSFQDLQDKDLLKSKFNGDTKSLTFNENCQQATDQLDTQKLHNTISDIKKQDKTAIRNFGKKSSVLKEKIYKG